jgi:hypothetical protein
MLIPVQAIRVREEDHVAATGIDEAASCETKEDTMELTRFR